MIAGNRLSYLKRKMYLLIFTFLSVTGCYVKGFAADSLIERSTDTSNQKKISNSYIYRSHLGKREYGMSIVLGTYRAYQTCYLELQPKRELIFWENNEYKLYSDLLTQSLKPEFMLLEVTEHPLSWLSAAAETYTPDFFTQFNIAENFNLLQNLGAGNLEPWSMSFFVGKLSTFWDLDNNYELFPAASGAAGLVATGGLYQIFDNRMIRSNWIRLEWKLKGEGRTETSSRHWDIKLGHRWYGIKKIPNTITLFLSRERLNKNQLDLGILSNSSLNFEFQVPADALNKGISRFYLSYGKVIPLRNSLIGLKLGYVFEHRVIYTDAVTGFSDDKQYLSEFFIQPMLIF